MNRKTRLIFSLIVSLLFLLYMFLDYFGYIRGYNIRRRDLSVYLKNYMRLDRASQNNRVVVSFQAEPKSEEDLNRILVFLNSLLDQSVRVNDITMMIPYSCSNIIPESMKNIVTIHKYAKGYGENTSLVYSLLKETNNDTIVIILDPNFVYSKEFIQDLTEKAEKNPNIVLRVSGTKGVLFRPKNFTSDPTNIIGENNIDPVSACCKNSVVEFFSDFEKEKV